MKSLYDVFHAIRADETDHVHTMQACLDEHSVLVSPSLEKKLLVGTGIVAVAAAILSGVDLAATNDLLSLNPGDAVVDSGATGLELDALVAGAAAVVSQVFGGGGSSEAIADATEVAGSVEAIKDGGLLAQFLGEGFAAGVAYKVLSGKNSDEKEADATAAEADVDENDDASATG